MLRSDAAPDCTRRVMGGRNKEHRPGEKGGTALGPFPTTVSIRVKRLVCQRM